MNNRFALSFIVALCCLTHALPAGGDQLWCEYPPGPGPGAGQHIVLISGDEEYRSEEALPMLGKILAQRHGFRCTVLFAIDPESGEIDPNNQNNIPGMEKLADADLVIMALRFRNLPDDQMQHFDKYLMSGRPIIALRTSTHAFRNSEDVENSYPQYGGNDQWRGGFGKQVIGETWVNHHGDHGSQATRVASLTRSAPTRRSCVAWKTFLDQRTFTEFERCQTTPKCCCMDRSSMACHPKMDRSRANKTIP